MNIEFIKRSLISFILLISIQYAYNSLLFYCSFLTLAFGITFLEISRFQGKKSFWSSPFGSIIFFYKLTIIYSYYLTITRLHRSIDILNIILYNSTSDIIQYLTGKFFGYHQLFSITSKTLEGYWGGICLTKIIFYNSGWDFVILNLIGMIGGLFSSYLKRTLGIKHWSNLLGPHGGVGDRLDSLVFPIIYYFYKY